MKITCSRKEDILRRKAEYEADRGRRQAEYDKQYQVYRDAEWDAMAPTQKALEDLMSKYNLLQSRVIVDRGSFRRPGLSVRIYVNEDNKFADNVALAWDYKAELSGEGEVLRETSSWSGMKAVTADQLADLEQSLNCLKELANLDWKALLDVTLPHWGDYITVDDPRYDRDVPNFKKELMEAEIEDIIGKRKMIEVKPFSGSWYYDSRFRRQDSVFIAIIRDSGSQYTIKECPMYAYRDGKAAKYFDEADTHRVKKDSIIPVDPINIIDV